MYSMAPEPRGSAKVFAILVVDPVFVVFDVADFALEALALLRR